MVDSAATRPATPLIDRARCARIADALAVAVAVALPWSTAATGILIALWLIALVPTLDLPRVRHALLHPAGGFPVAFWSLGALGMLWADVTLAERLDGLMGFHKLLMIPLLLIQFRRSNKGIWVLAGFVVSCTALLALSWLDWFGPLGIDGSLRGVPVKDYLAQSGEFLICAFGLSHWAVTAWREGRRRVACALGALAAVFLVNLFFVATGRTSLVVYAMLVIIIAFQRFGGRAAWCVAAAGSIFAAASFATSPRLQKRVFGVAEEIQKYEAANVKTSTGIRLEFWRKSVDFVAAAPMIGHGTGSIRDLFRRAAVGKTGASATVTGNPHNMTLMVAIQLGVVSIALLYAMWIAHLLLFRGTDFPSWLGLGVVLQNVVSSLTLAHLFDFTSGWLYVFGVGVLGGTVLGRGDERSGQPCRSADDHGLHAPGEGTPSRIG